MKHGAMNEVQEHFTGEEIFQFENARILEVCETFPFPVNFNRLFPLCGISYASWRKYFYETAWTISLRR